MRIDRPTGLREATGAWGSDFLAEVMRALGIEYVAVVPGASFRGLHDSLVNHLGNVDPAMLMALHEENAVSIAHGYAKVTGKPMAVILHSNVGLMHATMAVFNAFCDRMPMLVFGATGPVDANLRRPWIDWIHTCTDQAALIRHFIKWDNQPASLPAAAEAMLRAAQIARTAPCGPTYVVFDCALQEAKPSELPALPDVARFAPSAPVHPAPDAIGSAAALLARAKKPLVLAGRMSRHLDHWRARIELAERLGASVLTDLKTAAAFPTDHPLHAMPVKYIGEEARALFENADVVLSLDWIDLAGTLKQVWKTGAVPATIIHASPDALVHNGWSMDHQALPPADVYLLADPDATVACLLQALEQAGVERARPAPPRKPAPSAATPGKQGIGVHALADAVNELAAGRQTSLIRINIGWPAAAMRYNHPLEFLGNDGGGGVGSGTGLAIGAALALLGTGRLPLAVLGDGDFLMSASALWTAVRHRIPVMIVVANNRSFFNDEMHQERMALQRGRPPENRWIGQRISAPDVGIVELARAHGAGAIGPVTETSELASAVREAADRTMRGEAVVVDVRIAAEYDAPLANLMVRGEK